MGLFLIFNFPFSNLNSPLPMVHVVIVPLFVVEAACGVDARLPEVFGNFL